MTKTNDGRTVAVNEERLMGDTDVAQVVEILRGATRGDRDPDADLAIIIAGLHPATEDALRSALVDLLKNAHPD